MFKCFSINIQSSRVSLGHFRPPRFQFVRAGVQATTVESTVNTRFASLCHDMAIHLKLIYTVCPTTKKEHETFFLVNYWEFNIPNNTTLKKKLKHEQGQYKVIRNKTSNTPRDHSSSAPVSPIALTARWSYHASWLPFILCLDHMLCKSANRHQV